MDAERLIDDRATGGGTACALLICHFRQREGNPAEELARAARAANADRIASGGWDELPTAAARLPLGRRARAMRRARRPNNAAHQLRPRMSSGLIFDGATALLDAGRRLLATGDEDVVDGEVVDDGADEPAQEGARRSVSTGTS